MIDPELLPSRGLFDTGILIRALRQKKDADSALCIELFEAMIEKKRTVLVAAASLAEVVRGTPGGAAPTLDGVEVVAFDDEAALVAGRKLPQAFLKEKSKRLGQSVGYLKYDAMIAACAVRHRADCIVTLDDGFHALCKELAIRITHPSDFVKKQQELQLVAPHKKADTE
jgi:predicted nucleic acid-binding protein